MLYISPLGRLPAKEAFHYKLKLWGSWMQQVFEGLETSVETLVRVLNALLE
jgi:hypothetical protein